MPMRWRDPCGRKRRLTSTPNEGNWVQLRNYWANTTPYPGYIPEDYPGLPMINSAYTAMLAEAITYLGLPYVWGGKAPPNFDCSGFVGYLYKAHGLIPEDVISYTGTLWTYVENNKVTKETALPGDWVLWNGSGGTMYEGNAHIGIWIGNDYVLDCSSGGVQYRLYTWHSTARLNGWYHVPSNIPEVIET